MGDVIYLKNFIKSTPVKFNTPETYIEYLKSYLCEEDVLDIIDSVNDPKIYYDMDMDMKLCAEEYYNLLNQGSNHE